MNRDPFGGAAASFDDPLAMLSACHGRIRRQLDTLSRLERHLPEHGCDTDARAAARAIIRYFDPPRRIITRTRKSTCSRASSPGRRRLRRWSRGSRTEHRTLAANWRHLRPLLAGIAAGQRAVLPPRLVRDATLAYDAHIETEENGADTARARLLRVEEIAAIGKAMAARRRRAAGTQITLE